MNDVTPSNYVSQLNQLESGIAGFRFSGQNLAQILSTSSPFSPINMIFYAIGVWFIINTIMGGISLMTSAGEPAKIGAAKSKITNSIIGFLVAFSAYWIVSLIGTVLGLGTVGNFQ